MRHIKDILQKFSTIDMKTFPFSSAFYHKFYLRYFRNIKVIKPLNYINYIKKDAMNLMSELYNWKPYPQKHSLNLDLQDFSKVIGCQQGLDLI